MSIEEKARFVTIWLGNERDIKSLLYEIVDLQLALSDPNRKKDVKLTLATISSIVTRLSMTYAEEDEIRTLGDEMIEMDYQLCLDKCKDMGMEKFYHRD